MGTWPRCGELQRGTASKSCSGPRAASDVALALICSQVVEPSAKASYSTWWADRSLGVDLAIAAVHTDECYEAMD